MFIKFKKSYWVIVSSKTGDIVKSVFGRLQIYDFKNQADAALRDIKSKKDLEVIKVGIGFKTRFTIITG